MNEKNKTVAQLSILEAAKIVEEFTNHLFINALSRARGGGDVQRYAAFSMALEALKKEIPEKTIHTEKKYGKHKWKLNSKGEVDEFAFDYEYHAGVVCERCGECVCTSCEPDYDDRNDCEVIKDECPICGAEVKRYEKQKRCNKCGQVLDWSDET